MGSKEFTKANEKTLQSIKTINFFVKLEYVVMSIVGVLFLIGGIRWTINKDYYNHNGAGIVMAFFYIGPIIILNVLTISGFIFISLGTLAAAIKKNSVYKYTILKCYKKYAMIFVAELLLSVVSMAIIF